MAYGYTAEDGTQVSAFRDMINGGGAGTSGDTFQGSPISGLLNALGVRPAGYAARQRQTAPQAAPARPSRPMSPPPVQASRSRAPDGLLGQVFPYQPAQSNAGRWAGDPMSAMQPQLTLGELIESLSGSPYPVRTSLEGLSAGPTMDPTSGALQRFLRGY